jgi:hypothetical protein
MALLGEPSSVEVSLVDQPLDELLQKNYGLQSVVGGYRALVAQQSSRPLIAVSAVSTMSSVSREEVLARRDSER